MAMTDGFLRRMDEYQQSMEWKFDEEHRSGQMAEVTRMKSLEENVRKTEIQVQKINEFVAMSQIFINSTQEFMDKSSRKFDEYQNRMENIHKSTERAIAEWRKEPEQRFETLTEPILGQRSSETRPENARSESQVGMETDRQTRSVLGSTPKERRQEGSERSTTTGFDLRTEQGVRQEYRSTHMVFDEMSIRRTGSHLHIEEIQTHQLGNSNKEVDVVDEFIKLVQENNVKAYTEKFEELRTGMLSLKPSLSEFYFVTSYISGLKDEIRNLVKLSRPKTLAAAYQEARMHYNALQTIISEFKEPVIFDTVASEIMDGNSQGTDVSAQSSVDMNASKNDCFGASLKGSRNWIDSVGTPNCMITNGESTLIPFDRGKPITQPVSSSSYKPNNFPSKPTFKNSELLQPKTSNPNPNQNSNSYKPKTSEPQRTHGLCYRCGDKYFAGHRCKLQTLHGLLSTEPENVQNAEFGELNSEIETENVDAAGESEVYEHSLTGSKPLNTIKIQGMVKGKPIVVLVDSGSNHSFLDPRVAKEVQFSMKETNVMMVAVANVNKMFSYQVCRKFEWEMQGHSFCFDMRTLKLGGCDLILGIDWLREFSPLSIDFKEQVSFKVLVFDPGITEVLSPEIEDIRGVQIQLNSFKEFTEVHFAEVHFAELMCDFGDSEASIDSFVFDPGGMFDHGQFQIDSSIASMLLGTCFVWDELVWVFDPGGILHTLQVSCEVVTVNAMAVNSIATLGANMELMGKRVLFLFLAFLVLSDGFSSVSVSIPPAKIVSEVLSNAITKLMKWAWSLKTTTKTENTSRQMMKFESGYEVETVFDGSELGIEPYSVELLPNEELLILDSANSNLYRISSSLSQYTRPKLVAGSVEGYSGHVDGKYREARMNHLKGIAVDDKGNVFVAVYSIGCKFNCNIITFLIFFPDFHYFPDFFVHES